MRLPQWIPKRTELAGVALSMAVGLVALAISRALPPSPYFSDILLALILGALLLNSPLRSWVGLEFPDFSRQPDRYELGLRYTNKWVLRAAIILMGLKVQTAQFAGGQLQLIAGLCLVALPTTFFVAHSAGALLKVRRPLVDLVAGGTMICGASAVNAIAPVSGAHRQEQGIAIGTVFLFSLVALVVFHPIAAVLGLSSHYAGLWSGLAVNDLSSAIAVGTQMGSDGGTAAAAAKSFRVLLLAPTLVVLALLRSKLGVKSVKKSALESVPKFMFGYLGLIAVRTACDRLFPGNEALAAVLTVNRVIIDVLLLGVAAAIGLHLDVRKLIGSSLRAMIVGASASVWMAALVLGLLWLFVHGLAAQAAFAGVLALAATYLGYRLTAGSGAQAKLIRARFESGAPLSLSEGIQVLGALEAEGVDDDDVRRRLLRQLYPSIGELIPVRSSPLPHGEGCRWVTYWEGTSGWALVAVSRDPGSSTPIHAHPHRMLGKALEGALEELKFREAAPNVVELEQRRMVGQNDLVETEALNTLHVVRVAGERAAIDLQLRGPEIGQPGKRMKVLEPVDFSLLRLGQRVSVQPEIDDRPGHGGEGAKAGRPPEARAG